MIGEFLGIDTDKALHRYFRIVEGTSGLVVADRNYHSPEMREELAKGMELLAPYSSSRRARSGSQKECSA